jgi:putative endonuclease
MWITTRETGKIGEDIACKWLENHGFLIVERNYLKKWGELDIVASKDKILHFIEVKSVVRSSSSVRMGHRPEENVHELKIKRLRRTIQTYLAERRIPIDATFQFHVLTVILNSETRRARINLLENIIL